MLMAMPLILEQLREFEAGELAALVGVEDLRCAVAVHRLLHRLDTEVRRQRVRQAPRQHPAAGPVHHRKQVHEAALHRDVSDVGSPDVVRALDLQSAQQVRIDRMCRMAPAGIGLPVQRFDAHLLHQRGHVLAPN